MTFFLPKFVMMVGWGMGNRKRREKLIDLTVDFYSANVSKEVEWGVSRIVAAFSIVSLPRDTTNDKSNNRQIDRQTDRGPGWKNANRWERNAQHSCTYTYIHVYIYIYVYGCICVIDDRVPVAFPVRMGGNLRVLLGPEDYTSAFRGYHWRQE